MTWIKERHRVWRIAILLMLLVAFLGPWIFDGIYVPPKYFCSPPNIRLDDYFCGVPMPVTWLYRWVVRSFIYSSSGLVTGEFVFTEWIREFLYSLFVFLPLLPVFSMLLLILRGNNQRVQVFTIFVWILAIGGALFFGLTNFLKLFWIVWGIWLYFALAISALTVEILLILSNRKDPEELTDVESVLL